MAENQPSGNRGSVPNWASPGSPQIALLILLMQLVISSLAAYNKTKIDQLTPQVEQCVQDN